MVLIRSATVEEFESQLLPSATLMRIKNLVTVSLSLVLCCKRVYGDYSVLLPRHTRSDVFVMVAQILQSICYLEMFVQGLKKYTCGLLR